MNHQRSFTAEERRLVRSLIVIYDNKREIFSHVPTAQFNDIDSTLHDFFVQPQNTVNPDISVQAVDSTLTILEYILNFYRYTVGISGSFESCTFALNSIISKVRMLSSPKMEYQCKEMARRSVKRRKRLSIYVRDLSRAACNPEEVSIDFVREYLVYSCLICRAIYIYIYIFI